MAPLLTRAGLGGGALPYLLYETKTGNDVNLGVNRFKGAFFEAPTYLMSSSVAAIEAGLGFKGALLANLKTAQTQPLAMQEELVKGINELTSLQAETMMLAPGSKQGREAFYQAAQCATQKNTQVLKTQKDVKVDVYQDSTLAPIWAKNFTGFSGGFDAGYKNQVTGLVGTSVAATLKGLAGACTAVLGGYDYHAGQTNTRAAQDDKDQFAGEVVANILMTARALNKKVFLYISADGSVSSPNDAATAPGQSWAGDYSERGMNYIIAYDPLGQIDARAFTSPSYKDASFQLNHFAPNSSEDLVVSSDNPIAGTEAQELCAAAVFLNFLSFAGRKDLIQRPTLSLVKKKLTESLPTGTSDIFQFYSRIAG
ncbi:MAG: hypothetical protein AB7F86_05455 [Bdellovibrionales bacterium]